MTTPTLEALVRALHAEAELLYAGLDAPSPALAEQLAAFSARLHAEAAVLSARPEELPLRDPEDEALVAGIRQASAFFTVGAEDDIREWRHQLYNAMIDLSFPLTHGRRKSKPHH